MAYSLNELNNRLPKLIVIMPNPAKYSKYSESESKFLKDNWLTMSDYEIAKALGRPSGAIAGTRQRLGLIRPKKPTFKCRLDAGLIEAEKMRKLFVTVADMKALIIICELETNQYKRDQYKSELRQLSGIKW